LDSYDKEDSLSGHHDEQRIKRIEELEETQARQTKELDQLQKESDRLSDENRKLEKYLAKTEFEVAKLAEKLGRGDYDPSKTKVIHFKHNPQSTAVVEYREATLKKLRNEITQLKEHIVALETAASSAQGQKTRAEQSTVSELKELQLLKQQLEDAKGREEKFQKTLESEEKKRIRMKEIFSTQVSSMRTAVYSLLGYKMELSQENVWRLKSMYAEKEEDCLMFQGSKKEKFSALETDFVKQLDQKTMEYLNFGQSIPAFLSEITLQGFARTTKTFPRRLSQSGT